MLENEKILGLIELKKFDQALLNIDKELLKNPEEPIYYYLASLCHFEKDEIESAIGKINIAISKNPNENDYKLHLAGLFFADDNLKSCAFLLDEITPIDEDEIEQKLELDAFLALRQEDFGYALAQGKKIIKLNPKNANAFGIVSFSELIIGSRKEANKLIKTALEIEPENNFSRYVYILNQVLHQDNKKSEDQILNFLSEDPNNKLYLDGLKFVLLSKNRISRLILKVRMFFARNLKFILGIYKVLFRILLIGAYFFYISSNFLFGYSSALLFAHSISSLPFKTMPLVQNLFLLSSRFRDKIISTPEIILSLLSTALVIIGIFSIWYKFGEFRWVSFGLSAIYISGLPFDYYYGIQKKYKSQFIGFTSISVVILLGLLGLNDKWLPLPYVLIIILLIAFPWWKRTASIKSVT